MTKNDLNIKDHKYIERKLRYFKRRGATQKTRDLVYRHLLACNIDPTICVDGKSFSLIKEHGGDSLTPLYSLPRVMSAPFQLTLCWNQVIAHEVFSNFIRHAYSTLRSLGLKTGHSKDYICYLKYLQKCLVGLQTFDVSAANKVREDWGGYLLNGREWVGGNLKDDEISLQTASLWLACLILEKWSGLTASYSPRYPDFGADNITKLIYLAVAEESKPMYRRGVVVFDPSHISDERSAAEMEWQKSLLLKYLFGQVKSAPDSR